MKYCTYCGKPSADENKFCQSCGKAFYIETVKHPKPVPQEIPTPVSKPKDEPVKLPADAVITPLASGILKDMLQMPLLLTAIILFSIAAFLNFILDLAGVGGSVQLFEISGLFQFAPYAVLCAGFWILFAQAKKSEENSMNGVGFLLVKIGAIGTVAIATMEIGFSGIAELVMGFANLFSGINGLHTAMSIPTVFDIFIATIYLGVCIFFCMIGIRMLDALKLTAIKGITDFKVPLLLIVTCYIHVGLDCVNIIYDLFYMFADGGVIKLLISLCEGAFFVIIALWLHKYKKELCVLQAFLKQVEEENQPGGSEEKF